jgi:hypothetical protein
MAATAQGKGHVAPRRRPARAGMASDVLGFAGAEAFAEARPFRPATSSPPSRSRPPKVVSTRPTEFEAAKATGSKGTVAPLAVDVGAVGTSYVKFEAR